MEYIGGQYLPKIDEDKCTNCKKCVKLCPGINIETFDERDFEKRFTGKHLESYSAYSKDKEILKNSTSGGTITQLILALNENDEYDGCFVLDFDTFKNEPARISLKKNKDKIKSSSKSKYVPASIYNIIDALNKEPNPNYIIVGTSCQIYGIKNYIKKMKINDENLLFFGLFCDKTLNYNIIDYFQEKYSKDNEKIVKFHYRDKEKNGWPGDVKLQFDSNREMILDKNSRIELKEYFQLERCLYCLDKLNRYADISFGDCYIAGKDQPGRSSIIIRTEKGKKVWEKYKDLFNWEKSSIESIKNSQAIYRKKKNIQHIRILGEKTEFAKMKPAKKIEKKIKNDFLKEKEYIKWGREKEFKKIKKSLHPTGFSLTFDNIRSAAAVGKIIFKNFLKDSSFKEKESKNAKNVVIVGGELFNKGAQAMTFTLVNHIKNRYPEKKIYLFSPKDYLRDEYEKEIYNFEMKPWNIGTKINLLSNSKSPISLKNEVKLEEITDIKDIIENTDFMIDISGYALSSQLKKHNQILSYGQYSYILNIMIAKKFKIPIYIFPQSIGPFNYPFFEKIILYPLLKKYLRYPVEVFPREKTGEEYLKRFKVNNVKRMKDIVLLNEKYDLDKIYRKKCKIKKISIDKESVGIIPNSRVLERVGEKKFYSIYEAIIKELLYSKKKVYILRHSHEDMSVCKHIKSLFESKQVELIFEDFNAIELESNIKQFDFIVASRYHSIVHSYKNGVPVIAIGWADKYYELLNDFNQLCYYFDCRNKLVMDDIIKSLKKIIKQNEKEKEVIKSTLKRIKKGENAFLFLPD
jgi:colanic acid/amylovoran biosynthesis protein